MKLVPLRKAVQALGLSKNTLRKYADQGIINVIRTPSGQRLFDLDSFTGQITKHTAIAYARVSSKEQKPDLERQVEYLSEYANEVIHDVGSGLNYKRKGLRALLERALRGERLKIVAASRDRIARFGWELVDFIVQKSGGEIVVLDQRVGSAEEELTQDLLHILHVFSCRMYGRRKYKSNQVEEDSALSYYSAEELAQALVRRLEKDLQQDGRTLRYSRGDSGLESD